MNYMSKLISSGVISFTEALIENYQKISLKETEAMILLKLYLYQKKKNNFLSIEEIKHEVSLSEEELSNAILLLVQKGYVDLLINDNSEEQFSLAPTMEKLGNVLSESNAESEAGLTSRKETLQNMILYLETTYQHPASSQDLSYLNLWLDKGYSLDEMKGAILDSVKAKKTHIKYADAILVSRHTSREQVTPDEDIKQLLEQVYVKKR